MALYSYLSFKSAHDPSDLNRHVVEGIESRFACPIAWRALFRVDQIDSKNFIALSTTVQAKTTLLERSPDLNSALGNDWQNGIERFVGLLDTAKYVELNLQDWFGNSEDFGGYMVETLSVFSEALHTGQKHLITRKPKISKKWSDYILQDKEWIFA